MAKIIIPFNNKDYLIDESNFSSAAASLQSHLSTVMSGSGATINFGGASYGIDSTKLSTETNDFIAHLGLIAGNGYKVVVNGVEYSVGSDKVAGAVSELEIVLGGLSAGDSGSTIEAAAGLYETGSNYTVMLKDWDTLLAEGIVHVDNGVVTTNADVNTGLNSSANVLNGDLVLPADGSVTSIGDAAFVLCEGLTSVVIPDSVISIGMSAFYMCANLTSVVIPDSVTEIGNYAFRACTNLTSAVIPDSVTNIGDYAFYGCENLTLTIHISNTSIGQHTFEDGPMVIAEISDSVTTIKEGEFINYRGLTQVTIPASVTEIGDYAFNSSVALKTVIFAPNSQLTTIGKFAFELCTRITDITIPKSVVIIDDNAFSTYCGTINFEENSQLKTIGKQAFLNSFITNISIPNGVTTIGYDAFKGSEELVEVIIPETVTSMGSSVFKYCSKLTSITFTGTIEQWNAIEKGEEWNLEVPATEVVCSNGTVAL